MQQHQALFPQLEEEMLPHQYQQDPHRLATQDILRDMDMVVLTAAHTVLVEECTVVHTVACTVVMAPVCMEGMVAME